MNRRNCPSSVQQKQRLVNGMFSAVCSLEAGVRQGRLLVLLRRRRRQYVNCVIHIGQSKSRRHAVVDARPPPGISHARLLRRFADHWLRRMS